MYKMFAAFYKQLEQQRRLQTRPVINDTCLTFFTNVQHVSDLKQKK